MEYISHTFMERWAVVESLHLMSIDSKYKINSFFHLENLTFFCEYILFWNTFFLLCSLFLSLNSNNWDTAHCSRRNEHSREKSRGRRILKNSSWLLFPKPGSAGCGWGWQEGQGQRQMSFRTSKQKNSFKLKSDSMKGGGWQERWLP